MSQHYWWPWQGTLCRTAYLLEQSTTQGWHVTTYPFLDVCISCFLPRHLWPNVCTSMLDQIPERSETEMVGPEWVPPPTQLGLF